MKQSRENKSTFGAWSRTDVAERVIQFLRRRYPNKMAERVADDLGLSIYTIRRLDERESAPSGWIMARMIAAYGPDFLAAVLPGFAWLDAAQRAERQAALEAEIAAKQRELQRIMEARP